MRVPQRGERPRTVKRVSAYVGSDRRESAVTIHDVIAIDDRREGLAVGIRAEAMPPLLLDDRPGGTESVQLDRSVTCGPAPNGVAAHIERALDGTLIAGKVDVRRPPYG